MNKQYDIIDAVGLRLLNVVTCATELHHRNHGAHVACRLLGVLVRPVTCKRDDDAATGRQ